MQVKHLNFYSHGKNSWNIYFFKSQTFFTAFTIFHLRTLLCATYFTARTSQIQHIIPLSIETNIPIVPFLLIFADKNILFFIKRTFPKYMF